MGNKLIIVKNNADNLTPVDSNDWLPVPFTSASFTPDIQKSGDNSVRSTRTEGAARITKMTESGSIDGELTYGVFDDLIAAVFCNEWVGGSLKSGGDVVQSFTAEEERKNLTANKFIPHLVFVETMSIQADYARESVSVKFGIKGGRPYEPQANSKVGDGVVTEETTKTKLIPSDIGFLRVGGVDICVNSVTLSITNTLIELPCLNSISPKTYRLGNSQKVEIKLDPELDDSTVGHYVKSLNEGSGEFFMEFEDPDDTSKKYNLSLPEIGFTSTIPSMTSSDDIERMDTSLTVQNMPAVLSRT